MNGSVGLALLPRFFVREHQKSETADELGIQRRAKRLQLETFFCIRMFCQAGGRIQAGHLHLKFVKNQGLYETSV